ncbi:MAG: ABC transporter ATP-binding protein, partial [Syntrophales bacterium]
MQVELRDIRKSFGRLTVIDGVSLEIEEGHLFTLLGPSGCGKTTLLKIVAGFHAPDAGQVLFGGTRVNAVPPHKRETGMVFQTYALFPHLTVFDNVAYGLRTRRTSQDQI